MTTTIGTRSIEKMLGNARNQHLSRPGARPAVSVKARARLRRATKKAAAKAVRRGKCTRCRKRWRDSDQLKTCSDCLLRLADLRLSWGKAAS